MKDIFVSCIMPTYNRRAFVPHAIRYFLRQDYPHKELIIVDDGTDSIGDLVPEHPAIRYYRLPQKITLGAKLNLACQWAKGNIIANWDDDDWYAPHRLSYQVDALQHDHIYMCGINRLLYFDIQTKNAFQYIYPPDQRTWLLGSSLCYKKEFWERNVFADINVGMDGLFVWKTTADHIHVLPDPTFSVHMIHDNNVSPKRTDGIWWHSYPVEEIERILNGDWECYRESELHGARKIIQPSVNGSFTQDSNRLRNVYACLVHENEDCILDMARNLHYHDPESRILIYNGSGNPRLIDPAHSYDRFGVVLYPDPVPVQWGYLHDFALKCMEFALDNFDFDTLTIVDSDQLCIRSGYADYLGRFLKSNPGAGMLSSMPARISHDNRTNLVALQAFKEYSLWKPLLQSFPDGENKFVHWTFWPSSVFTVNAVRDLVRLFQENELLKEIMKKTKIWATEEVIFPTLVRLLGYEIVQNPCSYDFVRYKKTYAIQDIETAFQKKEVYWMHPVCRNFNDPLRRVIRERSNNYTAGNTIKVTEGNSPPAFPGKPELIKSVRKIEGWLSDNEAGLLIDTTLKAGTAFPASHFLETGSYHGKSTVLAGTVIRMCFPGVKLYAIDSHDGKLGAMDQGLQSYPPSLEMFKNNIRNAGLADIVQIIQDKPGNVKWDAPVSFLFIDGLHDYPNVSSEFHHFSRYVNPGGYVAFHDYAAYFPGVKKLVHEILSTGEYHKIRHVDTLIVLQKAYDPYTID